MSTAQSPLLEGHDQVTSQENNDGSYGAVQDGPRRRQSRSSRWLQASPAWMLALTAVAAISTSGTVAPRIEIYTRTICRAHGLDTGPASCNTDPNVQADAARLIGFLATLSGTLATLTAAWWGALSDCYGRIGVLRFNVAGLMVSDLSFLTVAHFWETLPGTYWWFAIGPAAEGLVGGISVASIVMHAYVSDCSDPAARSRAFSQLMGLLFVGMSVGPLLAGYIMRTTGKLLPVFYITSIIDAIVTLVVWLIMPESLSAAEMEKRTAQRAHHLRSLGSGWAGWLKRVASTVDVISPLSVLLPRKTADAGNKHTIDWSMTVLGAAYGFGTLIQASIPQQIQYAWVMFDWTSSVVSYWLGAIHIAKALYLALIFPGIVKLLTLWWSRRQLSNSNSEHASPDDAQGPDARSPKRISPAAFMDLILARAAVVTDIVFYALTFSANTGLRFALFTMGISFGTSFNPTMQSLALGLYAQRGGSDTGRLLGALTVVSALSSHIIGPTLFGITFARTVATLPGSFFLLGCAALVVSLVLLLFIRLRNEEPRPLGAGELSADDDGLGPTQNANLVDSQ